MRDLFATYSIFLFEPGPRCFSILMPLLGINALNFSLKDINCYRAVSM